VPAKAELSTEYVQKHEYDNDQQHDRENSAATAATRLHHGRVFARHIIAIIGHWKLSLFTL
jgi:hypothetical protein